MADLAPTKENQSTKFNVQTSRLGNTGQVAETKSFLKDLKPSTNKLDIAKAN
jgi:hypothetical protein